MTWPLIALLIVIAWLAISAAVALLLGRLLHRNQPAPTAGQAKRNGNVTALIDQVGDDVDRTVFITKPQGPAA
jgi:hypothetical protein